MPHSRDTHPQQSPQLREREPAAAGEFDRLNWFDRAGCRLFGQIQWIFIKGMFAVFLATMSLGWALWGEANTISGIMAPWLFLSAMLVLAAGCGLTLTDLFKQEREARQFAFELVNKDKLDAIRQAMMVAEADKRHRKY